MAKRKHALKCEYTRDLSIVLVDESDRHYLHEYAWRISWQDPPRPRIVSSGHPTLHRLIMGARPGEVVDHINGNTLDNRRCNLRIVTAAQNSQNKRARSRSGVLGVVWHKGSQKWQVSYKRGGKAHYFGLFASLEDATSAAVRAREQLSPGIVRADGAAA